MHILFSQIQGTTRRIARLFAALLRIPANLQLQERLIQLFAFPQHAWAKRLRQDLAADRLDFTWREYVNPLYWTVWGWDFFRRWITTRPYMSLAPGIPSALVTLFLCAFVLLYVVRDQDVTRSVYLEELRDALTSGDTKSASVAAQRLLSIDPFNLEHQYQLAMLDNETGNRNEAVASMMRLALQERYGPAALWMLLALIYEDASPAVTDLQDGVPNVPRKEEWTEDEIALCHQCASIAISNLPSNRSRFAKRLYAAFLIDRGYSGDALRLYKSIAEYDPQVSLTAALLANELGNFPESRRFAKAAIVYLGPKLEANPTNNSLRLQFAQALVLDEQDDEAIAVLSDGLKISPGEKAFTEAAGEALIFKATRLKRTVGEEESLLQRATLVTEAVRFAPKSPLVLEAVVQVAIECSESDGDRMQKVREALLTGVSPVAMHFVEGTVLLMAGETEAAQAHLELAAKEGGQMAGLLNNLAVALAESGDEHLPKALRFANEAIRQLPDHPSLLETRGQILLRMGQYQSAINDLEKSLESPALRPLAHAGLAKAYQAIGLDELAQQNRALSEKYSTTATQPD